MSRLAQLSALSERYAEVLRLDRWIFPTTNFEVTTWFGESGPRWSSGNHTGIDMSTPLGTPVVAVTAGKVSAAGWDGPYGLQVRLRLENGDEVWYNHLSAISVGAGQAVQQADKLGAVGDTGNSFGSHLHLEYRRTGNLSDGVDPRPFILSHGLTL